MIGHLAMLTFSALVAFSFTFGRSVAQDIDPEVITGLRFVVAFLALAFLAWLRNMQVSFLWRNLWRWMLIGGLMASYFITMFEALAVTTALSTSAVFTLAPLIAALIGWALLGVTTNIAALSALALGGIGALWVIFGADINRVLRFEVGYGETLFFFGTIAHAAVPAVNRQLAPGVSPLQASLGTVFGALVVTAIYAFPSTIETDFGALPLRVWLVVLYLGLATTALTFFLIQVAIPRLQPEKVMAYTYLVPSWVLLHGFVQGIAQPALVLFGVGLTLVALFLLLMQDVLDQEAPRLQRPSAADL
nr:DMT family transporter [Cognatishimia activa]